METHDKLLSILLHEDDKQTKRDKRSNPYRIGIMLKALSDAESEKNLRDGILGYFTHTRMRDRMLRVVGIEPCKCTRQGSCELCR